MKDHIVFVIGNYKNGGVAMRATNLANQFAKNGYKITLLVTKSIGQEIFFQQNEHVELVSLDQYTNGIVLNESEKNYVSRNRKIKNLKRIRSLVGFFPALDRRIKSEISGLRRSEKLRNYVIRNSDAIYIPFGIACYEMTYYASLNKKSKIIYAERNAAELECPSDPIDQKNIFRILKRTDGAVLQTQNEFDFYKGCLENNVAVIHNPIKNGLPEPYTGERRKVVVNFCRISEQKNLPLLFGAFEKLHDDYPEYSLEIYGNAVEETEETLRDSLIEQLKHNGCDKYIHILPPCANVHELIRDCSMFVSSSTFEGLSNSMIEAMAIGMPCVCTDCLGGGAREMIKNGENGILVPNGNEESLYLGMKQFVDSPEFAKKCGIEAAKIRNSMNAETIGEQWMTLIKKIAK